MINGLSIMLVLILLGLTFSPVSAFRNCSENEFFNEVTGKCQVCSTCDGLLSRVCSEMHDTLCGIVVDKNLNFSFLEYKHSWNNNPKQQDTPTVLQSYEDEEYWKNLAIALIAVVSVLTVVSTLIVMLDCYRFRKYNLSCKGVATDQGDVAESGYVVIHGFIPPGVTSSPSVANEHTSTETHPFVYYHGRNNRSLAYKPKRRLMNEYVDDVFESDDSGGSRTLRLPTIHEKSDSDCTDSAPSP